MKKSTVAAVAAAALLGFGAVGSANAELEMSGFADIQYTAAASVGDGPCQDTQGQCFRGSGEIDVIQKGDGPTFRADIDFLNVLNNSAQGDVAGPDASNVATGAQTGLSIEQFYVNVPVMDMASVKAGVLDSPFGFEGQDSTDYNFVDNGLLWQAVPSVIVGGLLNVAPTDMLSINLGYINSRADATGIVVDNANDFVVTVGVMPMEGVTVNLGYLTDNGTESGSVCPSGSATKGCFGDQFDINATVDMVPNLSVSADYQAGDPATGSGAFDSGYGFNASYTMMDITGAARWEKATNEGTTGDQTWTSLSVGYPLAEQTLVRLDWTNQNNEKTTNANTDVVTVQLLHTF